ncbi:MAG: hypothetical protein MAG715_00358 [Methanonatronarchaeales archaeon]|nr:hypothetical protein [Methanonatronarchaeales archaeon]
MSASSGRAALRDTSSDAMARTPPPVLVSGLETLSYDLLQNASTPCTLDGQKVLSVLQVEAAVDSDPCRVVAPVLYAA